MVDALQDWYGVHSMKTSTGSDPLSKQVRELVDSVLRQGDFPSNEELRRQASTLTVVGGPITMLDLQVDAATPASDFANGPVPLLAEVSDAEGMAIGELIVWVDGGYLSVLEFAWWSDDPPDQLPAPDRVQVTRK